MDRLASATSTLYPNESYSFDTLGRMSTRFISGTPYAYTYGDPAHVDAPTAYQGNSYGYDAAGQQTSGPVGGRAETRSFDPEHRLAQVTTTGNASATIGFVYDGTGTRLLQTVTSQGTTTTTLYIGNLYEEQVDADAGENTAYTSYYYLGAQLVGLRRAHQGDASTNGVYRLVGDHLGSVTLLVDDARPPAVAQRAYYTPYGQRAHQAVSAGSLAPVVAAVPLTPPQPAPAPGPPGCRPGPRCPPTGGSAPARCPPRRARRPSAGCGSSTRGA